MRKLIELIINDESKLSENSKIKELIELLNYSTEEELKEFHNEFEMILNTTSIGSINRSREVLEYINKEVKSRQNNTVLLNVTRVLYI